MQLSWAQEDPEAAKGLLGISALQVRSQSGQLHDIMTSFFDTFVMERKRLETSRWNICGMIDLFSQSIIIRRQKKPTDMALQSSSRRLPCPQSQHLSNRRRRLFVALAATGVGRKGMMTSKWRRLGRWLWWAAVAVGRAPCYNASWLGKPSQSSLEIMVMLM